MANDGENEYGATVIVIPRHHHREIKEAGDSSDGIDSISSPFIPTIFTIRISVLSTRWRHVWFDTPSLSFDKYNLKVDLIKKKKTLTRYTTTKMMSFELCTNMSNNIPYIDSWIEFAMSRNVENMSLSFDWCVSDNYNVLDFFYINSSVKQLTVKLRYFDLMIHSCSVSWTFLKKLSLLFFQTL